MEVTSEAVSQKLHRLTKVSRYAQWFFAAASTVPIIVALVAFCAIAFDANAAPVAIERLIQLIPAAIPMIILSVVFIVCASLLHDIALGKTPFSLKQARRIRVIGWMFILYAFCDSITNFSLIASPVGQTAAGFAHEDAPAFGVNLTAIGLAAVFFCFSAIFKYGSLLQEVSDDTI